MAMNEKDAIRFIKSSDSAASCPNSALPEFAFIGRSNVGKSSWINRLAGRKGLAKTSQTPGKTQLINHFIFHNEWHLVDLPGYGFAKTSKSNREGFGQLISDYVLKREQLACMCVLIDSRLEPQAIDLRFLEFLGSHGIPFVILFTKTDKQSANKTQQNVSRFKKALLSQWETLPPYFLTSAETGAGKEEVLTFLKETAAQFGQ